MVTTIKQRAPDLLRAFGAAAMAIAGLSLAAFAGNWKQCGAPDAALGVVFLSWMLGFPIFLLAGVAGFCFGLFVRGRTAWIAFATLCLLPAVAAAIFVVNAAPCKGIDL